ncbi:hypothetical protein ACLMJK_004602 [Lecanora helva]
MKLTSRLSRSAIDATRFTATSPHAYSKPTPSLRSSAPVSSTTSTSSTSSPRTPPQFQSANRSPNPNATNNNNAPKLRFRPPQQPEGPTFQETAAEKVARLRAQRIAEREAQVSRWDKIVVRGRKWADRAHRITVLFLVLFSIVAAGITVFALSDMILHNRRKRSAFFTEQRALYAERLLGAIEAEKAGLELDDDQTLIINRERARVQAEEAKKERSWGKTIKGVLMGGLKGEEGVVGEGGRVESEAEVLERIGVGGMEVLRGAEGKGGEGEGLGGKGGQDGGSGGGGGGLLQTIEGKRREGEKALEARGVTGGPLDQMAEEAVKEVKSKSGWFGWGR